MVVVVVQTDLLYKLQLLLSCCVDAADTLVLVLVYWSLLAEY